MVYSSTSVNCPNAKLSTANEEPLLLLAAETENDHPFVTYTLETTYKVAIWPRDNLLYEQIYFISESDVPLKWIIGPLKYLLYK